MRAGMIDFSAEPEDVAKALLALVLGFVVQAAIIGEVEPEMISRGLHWIGGAATEKGVAAPLHPIAPLKQKGAKRI